MKSFPYSMIIPCGHQKNGDQEAEGEMIHSTLSPHNSSSDARISAQKNGDASVRSNLYCYNPKSVRSDPSGAEEEAEEDGEEEECVDDNVTDLDLKLPSTIIKNDQRNVSGLFMARSGEPSDIPRDRIHRIKDDWLDLRLGIGSHEDSSNRFTGMIDNSCRLDVFDASINGTPESAGLCTLQLLPQIHTDQSESPLQLGNLRSKPIINENMKSCGGINRKDLDQDIDLLTGRLNRNSDYTFLDHRNSIREQFLGAVPPTVNVSMLLQGGHSKASAAISALPFHFNRRSAEIQKWPASDQIKALGDNEGSMMIKNSIENPNDAYESSLIQPDLIIRSSKGRLISHQDYTSNNASANHRNHRSMNPSMPLWTQTAIQSNDAPAIGLLSPFDSRVISPDAINTTSRTRAVSGFWFSLQPDDPNHLSQEEVPKPYLRIRDGEMPIHAVKKYLVTKLGLSSEAQVELKCRGRCLAENASLKSVRDEIWLPSDSTLKQTLNFNSSTNYISIGKINPNPNPNPNSSHLLRECVPILSYHISKSSNTINTLALKT